MSDSICYKVHDRNGDLVTSGFEDILTFNWYTNGDKEDTGKVWVEPEFPYTLSVDTGYGVIKELVEALKEVQQLFRCEYHDEKVLITKVNDLLAKLEAK